MRVVSNTSPLTNLAAISRFGLVEKLYGQLFIAEGVWSELNAFGHVWPGREEVAASAWVSRQAVLNTPLVGALRRDLDQGEAETIALALELEADLVLMDEREGRHAAQRLGLRTVGVVGLLLDGKQRGLVPDVHHAFDALRTVGFYLSEKVYRRGLDLAGELEDG